MVDEIVFLDSEIILDDDGKDAPVGKLVNVTGKPRTPKAGSSAPVVAKAVSAPTAKEESKNEKAPTKDEGKKKAAEKPVEVVKTVPAKEAKQSENKTASAKDEAASSKAQQTASAKTQTASNTPVSVKKEAALAKEETASQEEKPKTRKAAKIVENDVAPPSPTASGHVSIKKFRSQNSAQNVLGKTDFTIDVTDTNKDEQPAPKKPAAKTKTSTDPWAAANIQNKNKNSKSKQTASAYNDNVKDEKDVKKKSVDTKTVKTETEKPQAKTAKSADTAKSQAKTASKTDTKPQAKTASKIDSSAQSAKKEANASPSQSKKQTAKPVVKKNNNSTTEEKNMAKETTKTETKSTAKPATKTAEATETVIVEGDASVPHGKFVIKRTDNDNFVFKLFSSNKRVVAIAAGPYTSLGACKNGIQSVINNSATAPIEDQTLKNIVEQKYPKWTIYEDKRGEFRLRLFATNGNMVAATNDGYLSKDAAKKGIEAIARAAKGADVVRNDDLW